MSASTSAVIRPLAGFKQALRRCRAERQVRRSYATTTDIQVEPQSRYPLPTPGFRTSQTTRQNRFEQGLRKIPVMPSPPSAVKACPDPLRVVYQSQMATLDPSGARTRLFSKNNAERARVGDVLMVRLKTGEPFSGVVLNIRQKHSPVDAAVLLRNQLTRVSVEMWFKIYSPNVEGIEIVQRRQKRARRARLYYMRNPKHDMGSVDGIVKQYLRTRVGGSSNLKGRDANSHKKKNKK